MFFLYYLSALQSRSVSFLQNIGRLRLDATQVFNNSNYIAHAFQNVVLNGSKYEHILHLLFSYQIVACAARSLDRAQQFVASHDAGTASAYGSYEELSRDANIGKFEKTQY